MRSIFNICICGAVLLSAALATGQSVNGSIAATANAAVSSATDSSASGSVSEAVSGGVSAVPSRRSGSGARRAAVQPSMPQGRTEILKLNRTKSLSARQVLAPGEVSRVGSGTAKGRISNQTASKAKLKSGGGDSENVTGVFPDSTRGTAFPNPSDAGTVSSLEWNQGFNFGFPDFAEEKFLNPTFKVGARSIRGESKRGIKLRAKRSDGLSNAPVTSLTSKPINSLKSDPFGGSPLRTSVDQEIQSPQ